MKKFSKIFALLLTVCMICGIGAVAASAAAASVSPTNQLLIPQVTDESGNLISGNFAYSDGTTTSGWTDGNAGGKAYTSWDTSKGYINFRQNLAQTVSGHTSSPYVEWNLSAGHYDTANMYTMNMRDYGYATVDLDYGTDSYKIQIGYHVYYASRSGTVNCYIEPMYKTFTELTDEELQAAIDANYAQLKADIVKYQEKGQLAGIDATDAAGEYAWTVEQAKPTKTLALVHGSHVYLVLRSMKKLGLTEYTAGNRADDYVDVYTLYDEDENAWYLTNSSTWAKTTASVKIGGINDFKHITFVAKTTEATETSGSYKFAVYVDGVFMFEKLVSGANYVAMFLDSVRQDITNNVKLADGYSYVFDNLSVNYYEKEYNSEAALGVDDLYDGAAVNKDILLYNLSDTIYNTNFKGLGGSVTIGSTTYNVPSLAREAISKLSGNATITSDMALYNLDMPAGATSLTINSTAPVTLSEETSKECVLSKGDGVYTVRKPLDEECVIVNWLDPLGNVVKSEKLIYGVKPSADSEINLDCVDPETGILYDVTDINGWSFNVSGELEAIRALKLEETAALESINIIPDADYTETQLVYYIGVFDEETKVVRPSMPNTGTYDAYTSTSTMKDQFYAAASGSTLVLLCDVEVAPLGIFKVQEGKTMSLDLNGYDYMLVEGARTAGVSGFEVYEGSTLNIYSSREGGRIFDARAYYGSGQNATLDGESFVFYKDNQAYSSSGFVTIPNTVDAATVNIGAFRGYEANLEYSGGTVVYATGKDFGTLDPTDEARNELLGGGKRTVNVDGGKFYLMARPAYAMFVATGPDFVVNVKNASFYSSHATYAIFHDYGTSSGSNKTTGYPRFTVNSTYNISNCDILSVNADGISKPNYTIASDGTATQNGYFAGAKDAYTKVFYEIAKDSVANIDNCTIVGQMYQNLNGKIYLGEKNVIATNNPTDKFKYMDGVTPIVANSAAATANMITLSYSHPHIYNDYDEFLVLKEGQTNYYVMIEGVFDRDYATATGSKPVKLVTMKDGSVAESVQELIAKAEWYDPDGNLYATTYDFIGDDVDAYSTEAFPTRDLGNGWYDVGYASWYNVTANAEKEFTLVAGTNKFNPLAGLVVDIENVQIRLDLAHTEFTYYLYIPQPKDASNIDFTITGDKANNTGFFQSATATDPYYASTYVKSESIVVNGVTIPVYRWSYFFAADGYTDIYKNIRFNVKEYDLNGNGTIEENEKNIPLTETYRTNVIDYARKVTEVYGHGDDATTMVYEMVRFMDSITTYINKGVPVAAAAEKFDVFYDAYDALCDCSEADAETGRKNCKHVIDLDKLAAPEDATEDSVVLENTETDQTALDEFVHSVSFGLSASKPRLDMYLMPIDGTYTVTVKYQKYSPSGVLTPVAASVSKQATTKTVTIDEETVALSIYRIVGIHIAEMSSMLDITVTANYTDESIEDKTVTGTYSLATYIMRNNELAVSKSLYAFSVAALDYKVTTADELEEAE